MTDSWIDIGHVRSVQPKQRMARVDLLPSYAPQVEDMTWLYTRLNDNTVLRSRVAKLQDQGDGLLVTFKPGVTQDNVARMRGAVVVVKEAELQPRAEAPWHSQELLGFQVMSDAGIVLGVVTTVFESPANDAIEIEKSDGSKMILPLIPEVVLAVDLDNEAITVGDIAPFVVD